MTALIIIPARLESTRLPRKMLLAETGKPLIVHAWENAKQTGHGVWVATDSDEIIGVMQNIPGWNVPTCIRTGQHPNGTSRMAELAVAGWIGDEDIACNVHGDEPEIPPALIDQVIGHLEQHPEWDCATAANCNRNLTIAEQANRNHVTVWATGGGLCKDFTRGEQGSTIADAELQSDDPVADWGRHIGIYAYRRAALLRYAVAGQCPREAAESLEQLRALHIGLKMGVVLTDYRPAGIDTREDYDAFVKRWKSQQE